MTAKSRLRAAAPMLLLCWLLVVFDGYDLIVYGTVLPALLDEPGWELGPRGAGLLGSLAFVGMMAGALLAGLLTDRIGRRRAILGCTAIFSLATVMCGIATDPATFGVFRLVAGLGLGGLVPSANALGAEFVPPRQRPVIATLMMSGIPVGGSVASVIGMVVLPVAGWRPMFWLALLGLVALLPACLRWLPESPDWLDGQNQPDRAATVRRQFGIAVDTTSQCALRTTSATVRHGPRALFRPPHRRSLLLLTLATTATLFTWYGLGTWLPQLMRNSGFALGPALGFLLALNIGAVAGSVLSAGSALRFGATNAGIVACLLAAVGLLLVLTRPANAVAYLALILAGIGTHGTQCLVIAVIASKYPSALRGTALGFALGVGRIGAVAAPQLGGLLLAAGLGLTANFLLFALAAVLTAAALLLTEYWSTTAHRAKGVPA